MSDALLAAMREEFAKFFERLEQHSVGAPPDSGSAQSDAFAKGIADFDAWAARVDRRLAAVEQQHALLLEELRAVHAQRQHLIDHLHVLEEWKAELERGVAKLQEISLDRV